jgi:hypothetical protein
MGSFAAGLLVGLLVALAGSAAAALLVCPRNRLP